MEMKTGNVIDIRTCFNSKKFFYIKKDRMLQENCKLLSSTCNKLNVQKFIQLKSFIVEIQKTSHDEERITKINYINSELFCNKKL